MGHSYDSGIKFSILIPVYNVERYLSECVESVLSQTYPAYEIILVDDGSKDISGHICDEYAAKHPFIKVFHKPNGGQLSARQYAIEKATGDFYIFLDSDDTLKPETLQVVQHTIVKYGCDCVIYDFERYSNGVSIESGFDLSQPDRIVTDKRELYRMFFLNQRFNSMCRKAVKSSLFTGKDYAEFYHIRRGEDLLQSMEVLESCKKAVIIPQPLYNYRMNDASVTHSVNYENFYVDFTIEEQMLALIQKTGGFAVDDMAELRDYWIKCFVNTVRYVALFDVTYQQKEEIWQKMKDSAYFKHFLAQGVTNPADVGWQAYYFRLFCTGKYRLIIRCEKMYTFLFAVRRWLLKQLCK